MLIAATSSLFLMFQSGAGLAYTEALARADRYKDDPTAQVWRDDKMDPFLKPKTTALLDRCYSGEHRRRMSFSLIVSFEKGRFDRVDSNDDSAVAACIADVFSEYRWPSPPYDDFAEKFNFELAPD
ncbi:MAG: hypothetical protein GC145_11235 [Caulobacter sp.]|nr:hypothetical protein [Caulobacter sp.]